MSTFRLAHLSDPHLSPPVLPFRWRDLASKRLLSRFAWRRKRHRHSPEVLATIAADVRDSAPDHIVITGDLTNFATPEEFDAAAAWLRDLGDPATITVSPGNHDALVSHATPDRFAPWRPWLGDDPEAGFPRLRVRGPVAILNLCSAVPTAPHLARGTLGADQLARLAALLRETKAEGLYRVLLLHHPVAAGAVSRRKSLTDAAELRRVLAEAGAELVLHGHAHEPLLHRVQGPGGAIPVLGVPSASTPHGQHDPAARWHAIEITRKTGVFRTRIVARGVGPDRRIEPLGAYALTA
ncbi:metallophosphoesterase family protein [Phenylobacterium sp.]|uniref:metallophosphoesterase family protein n=1 Tax=Phenylobacterium sp. TaxID=1871053 RepID=UPI00391DF2B5